MKLSPRIPFGAAIALGACLAPMDLHAQGIGALSGMAVDATSTAPLEGVSVELLERGWATASNAEGRFVFTEIPAGNITLRVTHPGYGTVVESFVVTAGEATLIQFPLLRIDVALGELLVRVRQSEEAAAGHAQTTLTADRPAAVTAADLLEQRVPGLAIRRTDGMVGSPSTVQIRGQKSITQSNAPAIFLDGVLIVDPTSGARGSLDVDGLGMLDVIPANQVRRIRVLKGPAAAVHYGGSANGVILIETGTGRDAR